MHTIPHTQFEVTRKGIEATTSSERARPTWRAGSSNTLSLPSWSLATRTEH